MWGERNQIGLLADQGRFQEAIRRVKLIKEEWHRNPILVTISEAALRHRKLDLAISLVERSSGYHRGIIEQKIAFSLFSLENPELQKRYIASSKVILKPYLELVQREVGSREKAVIFSVESRPLANRELIIVSDYTRRDFIKAEKATEEERHPSDGSIPIIGTIGGIPEGFYPADSWLLLVNNKLEVLSRYQLEEISHIEDLYYDDLAQTIVIFSETRQYGIALRNRAKYEQIQFQEREDQGLQAHWRRAGLEYECAVCKNPINTGELSWAVSIASLTTSYDFLGKATEEWKVSDTKEAKVLLKRGKITTADIVALRGNLRVCSNCLPPPESKKEETRAEEKRKVEEEFRATPRYQAVILDGEFNPVTTLMSKRYSNPIAKALHWLEKEKLLLIQLGEAPNFLIHCFNLPSEHLWEFYWQWDQKKGGLYRIEGSSGTKELQSRKKGPRSFSYEPPYIVFDNGFKIHITSGNITLD